VVPEQSELLLADLDGAAAELGNEDLVTGLDAQRYPLAVLVVEAGADSEDLALVELLHGAVGRKMPEEVLVSAFMRCTRTRSRRGARDLMFLSMD
jgi:hypothetical protein